ncbi:cysteine desulfurase [Theileria orientalis]|uniref:cysteine desulfurase n=1 Tax=Theileria orientalis TaxID=68886 RepID=A0A976M658_THEOR|nr:cysteine desulfurase [Theileria orientalis]
MTCITNSLKVDNKNSLLFLSPLIATKEVLKTRTVNEPVEKIDGLARDQFKILNRNDHGLRDLVYLNNATTTHKPEIVLEAVYDYYTTHNFSVYRGSGTHHDQISTTIYESARKKIADFVNALDSSEILFTSGVTESLNFVSNTWGLKYLKRGDVVLLPFSEHNSNLLPWRNLCDKVGCRIEHVKLLKNGMVDLDHLRHLLENSSPKILCCGHSSNVVGVVQDLKTITKLAHQYGCYVLADAAQTVGKVKVDVQDMDVDFLAASGHKMYGPTGIGFLYYKKHLLEDLKPQKTGGGIVKDVTFEGCEYLDVPYRFEAGTPPIAQAIGLAAAVDFINSVGFDKIQEHDRKLLLYLYQRVKDLVTLYNFDPKLERLPILAFNVEGVDPFDLCSLLATKNIITRAGKHCANILHETYYCTNTIRVSLAMYNSSREIDIFVDALKDAIKTLRPGNLPVGYFKRIVNPANNPNLRKLKYVDHDGNSNRGVERSRCVLTDGIESTFSILKVNSKLVDKKNLNKYLKKVMSRDSTKEEMQYLLKYIVSNMGGSLDDGNLLTILIMMSKLELRDSLLLDALLPHLYKMEDFSKIADCLLYSGMMFGTNEGLKMLAIKVIYDLPKHANYISYNSIAKLCESLCHLRLYSADFGNLIASFVDSDTLSSNELSMVNFSSILNYLSRVGVGDENAWKLYMRYSLDNLVASNHKTILKLLQSCVNRSVYNKKLFRNWGDSLTRFIDRMHPNDVADTSYCYFRMNFRHDDLFGSIFRFGERMATSLDGKASLRLLSGYHMYFSSHSTDPAVSPTLSRDSLLKDTHIYRTVYLIYNNISTSLNDLGFEEFLLLFKTLGTFKFINTRNLQMSLNSFLKTPAICQNASKVYLIKYRYSERRSIDPSQLSLIRSLMP